MHAEFGVKLEFGQLLSTDTLFQIAGLDDLLDRHEQDRPEERDYKQPPGDILHLVWAFEKRHRTKHKLKNQAKCIRKKGGRVVSESYRRNLPRSNRITARAVLTKECRRRSKYGSSRA